MAKMVKDTAKVVHPITGEEGDWIKVIKNFSDPAIAGDRTFKGMAFRCKGRKVTLDPKGADITALVG